jgi:hypothetical protein
MALWEHFHLLLSEINLLTFPVVRAPLCATL